MLELYDERCEHLTGLSHVLSSDTLKSAVSKVGDLTLSACAVAEYCVAVCDIDLVSNCFDLSDLIRSESAQRIGRLFLLTFQIDDRHLTDSCSRLLYLCDLSLHFISEAFCFLHCQLRSHIEFCHFTLLLKANMFYLLDMMCQNCANCRITDRSLNQAGPCLRALSEAS